MSTVAWLGIFCISLMLSFTVVLHMLIHDAPLGPLCGTTVCLAFSFYGAVRSAIEYHASLVGRDG
jgi:EamA domain-containing membrane protein RarD